MEETKLEKLARLSGKATSKALDALGKRGFDIRGKLSTPISRVPRRAPQPKPQSSEADPETIYNWRRLDDRVKRPVSRPNSNSRTSKPWVFATSSISGFTAMKRLCRTRRQVSAASA